MLIRLSIQLLTAALVTLLLIQVDPEGFYLRTDTLSVDWLGASIFVCTLWGIQLACFQAFRRFPKQKRWALSLLVSIPGGICTALLLYSLVFTIVWATAL